MLKDETGGNIMNLSTRELFTQLQSKLIIPLEDNEVICPSCKGLTYILIESHDKAHIKSCRLCYTGKLYTCKYCGCNYKSSQCECKDAERERSNKFYTEQANKELEAYNKANKRNFKDYDGKFLLGSDEYVKDKDDIEAWIYQKLIDGEDIPEYVWATESDEVFTIDLLEVISDKCEYGYDDMYDRLDTKSELLVKAQELISQWEDEQGESMNVYSETNKVAVLLGDIVEEIRLEIRL